MSSSCTELSPTGDRANPNMGLGMSEYRDQGVAGTAITHRGPWNRVVGRPSCVVGNDEMNERFALQFDQ